MNSRTATRTGAVLLSLLVLCSEVQMEHRYVFIVAGGDSLINLPFTVAVAAILRGLNMRVGRNTVSS